MDQSEIDLLKELLRRKEQAAKEVWLEKQLLRNIILDSGSMSEAELDAAIESAKKLPDNLRQVEEHFVSSDQLLAEIGLADWLRDFEKKHPSSD